MYTTWGAFNIRPHLQAPYNDSSLYPIGPQVISLPLELHTSTYANLAAPLKEFSKQPMPSSAGSRIREDVMVPYTELLVDLPKKAPVDLPASTEPMLNSIGVSVITGT